MRGRCSIYIISYHTKMINGCMKQRKTKTHRLISSMLTILYAIAINKFRTNLRIVRKWHIRPILQNYLISTHAIQEVIIYNIIWKQNKTKQKRTTTTTTKKKDFTIVLYLDLIFTFDSWLSAVARHILNEVCYFCPIFVLILYVFFMRFRIKIYLLFFNAWKCKYMRMGQT